MIKKRDLSESHEFRILYESLKSKIDFNRLLIVQKVTIPSLRIDKKKSTIPRKSMIPRNLINFLKSRSSGNSLSPRNHMDQFKPRRIGGSLNLMILWKSRGLRNSGNWRKSRSSHRSRAWLTTVRAAII